MKLIVVFMLLICAFLPIASAETSPIRTDAQARALLESDTFLESSFSERVDILDAAIAGLSEDADPVVRARLTEKKLYTLTTLGNYAVASQFLTEIEDQFFDIADGTDFHLSALASSAFINSYAGNIEKALEYAERAQKNNAYKTDVFQQFRLTTPLASIYVNVGYAELGAELLIDFYEANKTADVDQKQMFGLVSNISYALNQAGDFERSLEYLSLVPEIIARLEESGDIPGVEIRQIKWHYLSNVARNRIDLGQFDDLSEIAATLEDLSEQVASPLLQLRSRYVKAAALYGDGQYSDAARLLRILIEDAERINSVDLIVDYQKLNVMVLKKTERYTEALAALEALQDAKARLDSQQGRSRLQYLNAQLSLQQKNFEIAELRNNNAVSAELRKREQRTSAILFISSVIFAVLAVSLYLSLRKSRLLAARLSVREREAVRAAEAKSRFLATMSHEIRTPLNAVLGITQLLQRKALEPDIQNNLSVLSDFGQMLLSIVNDVLDLSQIDAGKMKISAAATDVKLILEQLADAWSPRLEDKGLTLTIGEAEPLPLVLIDAMRVRQCLNNLISNAVKFTEAGRVAVRTTYDAEQSLLTFEVEDTGIGIPADRIEQLFEAFEQEDASTARRFGGTGLGLSIVRTLADLMGGDIRLVSTPGVGTTAILTLQAPLAPDTGDRLALDQRLSEQTETAPAELSRCARLLVVDDHPVNRMIISAFLASDRIEITEAGSGREALDLLEAGQSFDCILLDNRMPNMDGRELMAHIRTTDSDFRNIRIIFITADAMEGDREKYLELGADGYVSKPIVREDVIKELQRLLS